MSMHSIEAMYALDKRELEEIMGVGKVKVSELSGAALDWAVAKCEGWVDDCNGWLYQATIKEVEEGSYKPSTDWAQGGSIIERERLALLYDTERLGWAASFYEGDYVFGGTPLIAAMRCYVASKLGAEVEIPEELQ